MPAAAPTTAPLISEETFSETSALASSISSRMITVIFSVTSVSAVPTPWLWPNSSATEAPQDHRGDEAARERAGDHQLRPRRLLAEVGRLGRSGRRASGERWLPD